MVEPSDALDKVLHLATLVGADLARFERESGLTAVPAATCCGSSAPPAPAPEQSLAAALGVSPRNVTGLVDALAASGHVTREPHPSDRRATLVTPTDNGAAAIRDLVEGHADLARQLFGHLPPDRLAAFTATLDETITTFARLVEES